MLGSSGATDFFLAAVECIKYFDVNSLYPFAMLNDMPINGTKVNSVGDLDSFFGFVKVEVTCPESVSRPLLPLKHEGKTIFPTGKWTGVYFSEELKAAKKYIPEYKFKLLNGYSFDKAQIFNKYVETLYETKKTTVGAERWIAKLLLNCLYGTFGRKKDTSNVFNVSAQDLPLYMLKYTITSIIQINPDLFTIVAKNKLLLENFQSLDSVLTVEGFQRSEFSLVKSNVAIASAITAYARIFMMPFKLDPSCAYSDTDSVFTNDILGLIEKLLGTELGEFKDELNGLEIKEARFLGIKQYGYWFEKENGQRVEKSVFAGVERNSLSFNDIINLSLGGAITIEDITRFHKSFNSLKLKVKNTNLNIEAKTDKILVGNKYIPKNVNII